MSTKVMFLVDYYANPHAGTESQLLQLIEHLDRSRYKPAMTVFRSSDYIESKQFPCSVNVLGINKLASFRSIVKIARYVLVLRREGYRLVHCYFNDSALIAPFFLKLGGIRVIVSRRDMGFWYTSYNLAILRLISPLIDRYVANCNAVKQLVHRQEWVPREKITVIYNGYKPSASINQLASAIKLPHISDNVPVIGVVANLRPIKRLDTLLEAFALTRKEYPEAYLIIVGDKATDETIKNFKSLEALADRLKIKERIVFTGQIKDPSPYINLFTVAVLCSESEGFSNSIIEYMQAGRPTVCTDTGGNSELIQNGFNGFLVPVGDSVALANCLIRLLGDTVLAHQIGEAGRATVHAYTQERMVTEQMACYDEVVAACH